MGNDGSVPAEARVCKGNIGNGEGGEWRPDKGGRQGKESGCVCVWSRKG